MNQTIFLKLAGILKSRGLLSDTRTISVEEQLAYFCIIIGQQQSYSVTSEMFERSNWTISKYFNKVLKAIIILQSDYIKRPYSLKDLEQKGFLSQNVMATCTFDMQFTYILVGWEGSAADSRVLKSALTKRDKLYVPEGTRYHLQEFWNNTPTDERELFNRRHSSLWNTIERTFGALKALFKILKDAPPFDFDVYVNIGIACCELHNYIRMEDHMDLFEDEEDDSSGEDWEDNNESDVEDSDSSDDVEDDVDIQRSTQKESAVQSARASYYRDVLAIQIWQNY
ncbi:uncharacterized protein [Aristolochia californica]|uniref:uncharacterized protein n=1 Tax=Aristolochia californica TaxID=171875 RepID=UPI0035DE526D